MYTCVTCGQSMQCSTLHSIPRRKASVSHAAHNTRTRGNNARAAQDLCSRRARFLEDREARTRCCLAQHDCITSGNTPVAHDKRSKKIQKEKPKRSKEKPKKILQEISGCYSASADAARAGSAVVDNLLTTCCGCRIFNAVATQMFLLACICKAKESQ